MIVNLKKIDNTAFYSQNGGGTASPYSSISLLKSKSTLARLYYTALKSVLILSTLFFAAVEYRKAVA